MVSRAEENGDDERGVWQPEITPSPTNQAEPNTPHVVLTRLPLKCSTRPCPLSDAPVGLQPHNPHSTTMPRYFLRGSLEHPSFRLPEIHSIATLFGFEVRVISEAPDKGILVIDVDNEECIERLLDRGILVL